MSRARYAILRLIKNKEGELFMKYIIDRIGPEIAVCETEDGGMIKLRAAELPMGAREGDVLKWEPEGWKVDREETERRRERVRRKLESLIE